MKKYITQAALLLLSVFSLGIFSSCSDDFFDTQPGGRIDPDDHYNSSLDAMLSYIGCFVYLQEIGEKQIILDGLLSDAMDVTDNADAYMVDINLHNLSSDNPYIDPSSYYKLIINVNEVLPNLPQIVDLDRDFDALTLQSYEGTLVTLRSWAYFMLAKLNGEVAIVPEDLNEFDPNVAPEYLTKDEVITLLIDELKSYYDAQDLLRFHVDHYVLLGELYLEQRDYANAYKYLKYAIDGPSHRKVFIVDKSYQEEAWENIFRNAADQYTTVFTAVPYSFVDNQKNTLEEWMHVDYDYMVKPVARLVDSFAAQIRVNGEIGDEFRGFGISVDTIVDGSAYINKYSIDEGIPHSADVILYRAADVHLLLAEAANRVGEHENALALLNDGFKAMGSATRPSAYVKWSANIGVRGRVSLANKVVPPSDTANPTIYIEDLIMEERAMELAFEGKRWFDLIRIAERRDDPAYLADKVAAKFEDEAVAEEIRTKLMDKANWFLPITKIEE